MQKPMNINHAHRLSKSSLILVFILMQYIFSPNSQLTAQTVESDQFINVITVGIQIKITPSITTSGASQSHENEKNENEEVIYGTAVIIGNIFKLHYALTILNPCAIDLSAKKKIEIHILKSGSKPESKGIPASILNINPRTGITLLDFIKTPTNKTWPKPSEITEFNLKNLVHVYHSKHSAADKQVKIYSNTWKISEYFPLGMKLVVESGDPDLATNLRNVFSGAPALKNGKLIGLISLYPPAASSMEPGNAICREYEKGTFLFPIHHAMGVVTHFMYLDDAPSRQKPTNITRIISDLSARVQGLQKNMDLIMENRDKRLLGYILDSDTTSKNKKEYTSELLEMPIRPQTFSGLFKGLKTASPGTQLLILDVLEKGKILNDETNIEKNRIIISRLPAFLDLVCDLDSVDHPCRKSLSVLALREQGMPALQKFILNKKEFSKGPRTEALKLWLNNKPCKESDQTWFVEHQEDMEALGVHESMYLELCQLN